MKVFKNIGSKERLIEVFQNVNKVKLNEKMGQFLDPKKTLEYSFENLIGGKLKVSKANTQVEGNETSVELVCIDNANNTITFRFTGVATEDENDGVFTFSDATLTSFSFDAADGESVNVGEENLQMFNAQHSAEILDVVTQHADVETNAEVPAFDLEEAIKIIDAIKMDSMPFGGEFDKMQTGKNYVDKKPVNDKIRVNSFELDKFVQETEKFLKLFPDDMEHVDRQIQFNNRLSDDTTVFFESLSPEIQLQYLQQGIFVIANEAGIDPRLILSKFSHDELREKVWEKIEPIIADMRLQQLNEKPEVEEGAYPEKMGKEFSPQTSYPKKRKKHSKKIKIKTTSDKPITIGEYKYPDNSKTFMKLLDTAEEDGHITSHEKIAEYISAAAKEIATEFDALHSREKDVFWENTYKKFLKKIKKINETGEIGVNVSNAINIGHNIHKDVINLINNQAGENIWSGGAMNALKFYDKVLEGIRDALYQDLGDSINTNAGAASDEISEQKYEDEDEFEITGLPDVPSGYEAKTAAVKDIEQDDEIIDDIPFTENRKEGNTDFNKILHLAGIKKQDDGEIGEEKAENKKDVEMGAGTEPVEPEVNVTDDKMIPDTIDADTYKAPIQSPEVNPDEPPKPSIDPNPDDVEALIRSKETPPEVNPDDEAMIGGVGDGSNLAQLAPDQVLKGIEVEMEHTEDPRIALEIVIDHLTELPDYYTRLEKMENDAEINGAGSTDPLNPSGCFPQEVLPPMGTNGEEENGDKEKEDILLGFKPHNVGDYVNENE